MVGQGKMLGNVVHRGYGAGIPDGRPVNYFEIGTDPESCPEAAEEYARNVYRSLSGERS